MSNPTISFTFRRLRLTGIVGLSFVLSLAGCDDAGKSSTIPPVIDTAPSTVDKAAEQVRAYPAPPPPSEPRPVNFPDVQQFELPNKMQVYVIENHEIPLVQARLVVETGTVNDPLLATMAAAMLGEGVAGKKKLTKAKIDAKIEQVGASLRVRAGVNNSAIHTTVLRKDLKMALGLVADLAIHPTFPAESLDKIKDEQKVNLRSTKSDGGALATQLLSQALYPEGHPYGRALPTEKQIDGINLEQIKRFHSTWYGANRAYLILAGDIDMASAETLARDTFGAWKPKDSYPDHPLNRFSSADYGKALPSKVQVHVVERNSISADIRWGNLSMARNHDDWIKLSVVNRYFGSGGMSARLFLDIRETRKLTYNISAHQSSSKTMGEFVIATQTKKISAMLDALFEHVDRLRAEEPSEEEFEAAVKGMALSFPLGIETAQQVARKVAHTLTYGLPEDYYKTYRDKLLAVKRQDMKTTASRFIHSVPIIVIVGRRTKIDKQLAKVEALRDAEIFHYDTELRRQE